MDESTWNAVRSVPPPRVAGVVPAFNEESSIGGVVKGLPSWVDPVIVVDDGSRDGTWGVLHALQDRRVVPLRHGRNRGVGAAIVTGYREALRMGADVAVVLGGDGQMDPADLPALLAPLLSGRADYTKGNRFLTGAVWREMWPSRLTGNVLLSFLTRWVSGCRGIFDSQCGYTAITREALLDIDLDALYPRYGFPNDLLLRICLQGKRVAEVPVSMRFYRGAASSIRPLSFARDLATVLLRGIRLRLRARRRGAARGDTLAMLTTCFPRFEGDGAGGFVLGMAAALARRGRRVRVVAPGAAGLPARARMGGVEVERFSYFCPRRLQRLAYGYGIPSALRRSALARVQVLPFCLFFALKALRACRDCDCLVSHWLLPSGLIGAMVRRLLGKRHIAVVHSGGLFMLERLPLRRLLARAVASGCDSLLFVTEEGRGRFLALLPSHVRDPVARRARVVPMGVKIPPLASGRERTAIRRRRGVDGRFVVLFMGRFVEIKGVEVLLEAYRSLDGSLLVLAGAGEREAMLRRRAESIGLPVRFVGYLRGREKEEWLTAADVLVLPSVTLPSGRAEGLPVVLLEAMARGVPVVASAVGGVGELVRDRENGLLVPERDPLSLRGALEKLRASGGLRERLRRGALSTARLLDWERVSERYMEVPRDHGR